MSGKASGSTFRLRIAVPRWVALESGRKADREDFLARLWNELDGVLGIHEGTLLSEEAASEGFETDSWTVDSGEAPRERDWVESQGIASVDVYFGSRREAEKATERLRAFSSLTLGTIEEQKPQDWDAEWKASFRGVSVPPCWQVLPPWESLPSGSSDLLIRINPGAGFGTGTHETTQLCLRAIAGLNGSRVLDFGSGSGILSIGAALLGATVNAVEIDPLANENAFENARMNGVESKITISTTLEGIQGPFDLVIANILKPVLLEFADRLIERLAPGGHVVLSGLIEKDVEAVSKTYGALLGRFPAVSALGDWRALVW